jgi:hypothetical protein
MSFLQNRDIFNLLVTDWLCLKDLVHLDSALCSHELRDLFLGLLHTVEYQIAFSSYSKDWWKNQQLFLKWLARRKMLESRGQLSVHQSLWDKLLVAEDVDYKPFLSGVRNLRFLGVQRNFSFGGISVCSRLNHLTLCNHLFPSIATDHVTTSLEQLTLQNSLFTFELISAFKNCDRLKSLKLVHVDCSPLTVIADDSSKVNALVEFLRPVEDVSLLGEISPFLEFFHLASEATSASQINHFRSVTLDTLLKAGPQSLAITPFLTHSPDIKDLTISRVSKLDMGEVLLSISRSAKRLESLHINHCRIENLQLNSQLEQEVQIFFRRLKFSSNILLRDEIFTAILRLTKDKLEHLELSYCGELSDDGYYQIARLCPSLRSLQIEDKRENWEGNQFTDRVGRVSQFFQQISRVRIVLWKGWLVESEKEKHDSEREVVYERW